MEALSTLIMIAVCTVVVIDLSGFIDDVEGILSRRMNIKARIPKPFSCSFCMTHWICLIWMLLTGRLTLALYTITLLLAYSTPLINDILITVKSLLSRLISKVMELISGI